MSDGLLVLDKPAGLSSARALAPLKHRCGKRTKVGHAGTLDPFATGVVLALVGDATRLSDLAMALPKTYRATVRFGRATDTCDPEGATTAEADPGAVPPGLAEALPAPGAIEQVPPAFSALKVDGRRAYKLARKGATPKLKARAVRLHACTILAVRWPDVEIELETGAGFYVRAFARDLGAAVGVPAHLAALRRTRVGPYRAEDGVAPDDADPDRALPGATLLEAAGVAIVDVARSDALAFASGRPLDRAGAGLTGVRTEDGLLVGLAMPAGGALHPTVVFSSARRALERAV